MLDQIVDSCNYLLHHFPDAEPCRDYLNSRVNQESQERFGFGYFPSVNNLQVLTDLVGEHYLQNNHLIYSKMIEDSLGPRSVNFCYFEDYPLIIPFRDTYGRVAGLIGRTLLNESERSAKGISKYKYTKDFKKNQFLFGLYENKKDIIEQNCVYIVEGQFDVIKAVEKGFKNIVGLGTSSMSSYQFAILSRYTNNFFLLLDNDSAGEKGRKMITNKFGEFANIQNFYLPDPYKDIDDYFSLSGEGTISLLVKD